MNFVINIQLHITFFFRTFYHATFVGDTIVEDKYRQACRKVIVDKCNIHLGKYLREQNHIFNTRREKQNIFFVCITVKVPSSRHTFTRTPKRRKL
jgi:hypothetical protein